MSLVKVDKFSELGLINFCAINLNNSSTPLDCLAEVFWKIALISLAKFLASSSGTSWNSYLSSLFPAKAKNKKIKKKYTNIWRSILFNFSYPIFF